MSLKKIGSIIKEARLSKNKSVNDLATNLKISQQQLKAIEEGRDDSVSYTHLTLPTIE